MKLEYPQGDWSLFVFCRPYELLYETFRARDLFPEIETRYCPKQQALFWRSRDAH